MSTYVRTNEAGDVIRKKRGEENDRKAGRLAGRQAGKYALNNCDMIKSHLLILKIKDEIRVDK